MLRILSLALVLVTGTATAQDRPTIAVDSYPMAYFAERLGGDAIDVLFLVPADRDPAFWRPGLKDITAIQNADLIALNGATFAEWVTKVSLPRSRVVDTSATFADNFIPTASVTHSHGADGEHSHTGTASYIWLDFGQAAVQAETLAAAMKRRMPELSDRIGTNLAELTGDLSTLDRKATSVTADLKGTTIIATHPRYQYFARAYGLDIRTLDWEAGAMPTKAQSEALDALAKETGAKLMIWEAPPPADALELAESTGLASVMFPPLAQRPEEGDFLGQLNKTLDALEGITTAGGG